ncbi:MAG: citramalate synthase [Chloroflexota bacterium]|nr:citramalate synthase [Chloroflexota bacterium]
MSEPVLLYDTTLRDGTQREGLTLSLEDKLKICRRLDEAGFPYIEGGWPGSNPKDEEFFAAARSITLRNARLAAFGSTRHRLNRPPDDPNLRALVEAQTPVTTIFGKSWLLHVTEVLGASAEENLAMIGDSVAYLRSHGREVVYDAEHFFDGYRDDAAYALATLRAAHAAGAETLVLCDTNGGCLTDEVREITRVVIDAFADGAAAPRFGIHVHDDAGLAVANSLAAVQAGARHVQGTVNGYGERCGNANIVTIWADLSLKAGYTTVPGADGLALLRPLSAYVAEVANIPPDGHQPYVGASAFAHKGGVHGAATLRVRDAYQHIDPALVGNETRLVVSELGGRANTHWLADRLGQSLEGVIDARELSRLVKALEAEGASYEGAEASFELLIRRRQPGYEPPFRVLASAVHVAWNDGEAETERALGPLGRVQRMSAEATVKLAVGSEVPHTAAEGNGPVDALDRALRKALATFYPLLDDVHLVDYKVRIVDGEAATAARTRVLIETRDGAGRTWTTVGSATNIIAASAAALVDSLEFAIWKSGARPRQRDIGAVPLAAAAVPAPPIRPPASGTT